MAKNLSDVSNQDLMSELKRRTTIDDAEIKKFSTLNSQLESKDKALTQFLTSQKVANLTELGDKIKGLEKRPTQDQLNQAVKDETNKYKGYVNPTIYRVNWINPLNFDKEAKKKGYKTQVEYDARPNITLTKYQNLLDDLREWTNTFYGKKPSDITDQITKLEKRPDIPITKEQWEKDYQNRPTQADFNKEQQTRIKVENDLIQEQNRNKQLEIQITNKDNDISQKDKTIQSLELKNEKLTENYKKLYGYLGDAWKLVSHLQKDLSATQQDKAHIQKELNDTLAILNKPTAEIGTQTDLTAEQITQMEKDLEYFRKLLYQGVNEIGKLEQELSAIRTEQTQKEQTIAELQTKVKDLTPNEQEKRLLEYCDTSKWNPNNYSNIKKELESWSNLRGDYSVIRKELIKVVDLLIEKVEIEQQYTQTSKELAVKNQELTNLQTKYDMEVKTKTELTRLLNIYRNCGIVLSNGSIEFSGIGYLKEFFADRKYNNLPTIFYWNPLIKNEAPTLEMEYHTSSMVFVSSSLISWPIQPASSYFLGFKVKPPKIKLQNQVNFDGRSVFPSFHNLTISSNCLFLDDGLKDVKGKFIVS